MKEAWIVNLNTRECMIVDYGTVRWESDWKNDFPHVKDCDYLDITVFTPQPYELTQNGIHYSWSLCYNGGIYTLYVTETHTNNDIKEAIHWLKNQFDVVHAYVQKIKMLKSA